MVRQGAKAVANGMIDMGAWFAERVHDKIPIVLKALKSIDPSQLEGTALLPQGPGNSLLQLPSGMNEVAA